MKEIKLGLVAGQRKLPLTVDGFVLDEIRPGEDMYNIHKAVQKSLEDKLGKYIHITEYGPSIDGVQEDVAHYACDAKLILYPVHYRARVCGDGCRCILRGKRRIAYGIPLRRQHG